MAGAELSASATGGKRRRRPYFVSRRKRRPDSADGRAGGSGSGAGTTERELRDLEAADQIADLEAALLPRGPVAAHGSEAKRDEGGIALPAPCSEARRAEGGIASPAAASKHATGFGKPFASLGTTFFGRNATFEPAGMPRTAPAGAPLAVVEAQSELMLLVPPPMPPREPRARGAEVPAHRSVGPLPTGETQRRCNDLELILVGQSVLVVLLARAWTDMGLFFHAHVFADAVGTCIFHLHHIAVVLCLGTLVNQVVISRLAPPDPGLSLAPATVGMSMGGTIAPAALQCKDESEVMGEAYAPLYLAFAVALFALLVELKRRLATTPASSLTRRYMIGFTELASNFLALSAAATLNATTKANIAFNAKEYLAAVVGGGVQSPRLPDPVLCQALWALAAFLILPSFLAAIAPLLASRLSILNFAIRLCAFYSAFQILNAVPTAIAEAQHTTVTISSSDAPLAHKAALALGMAALLALTRSLMLSGQRASLEEVSKGAKDGLDREEIEQAREAFLEHTMGLSLGWSWHPFVKACFVAACEAVSSQGEAVETVGVVLYTVVATLLVYQLYSALWRAAADRTSKTDSAADAGFTAGDAADAHVGDHGDAG